MTATERAGEFKSGTRRGSPDRPPQPPSFSAHSPLRFPPPATTASHDVPRHHLLAAEAFYVAMAEAEPQPSVRLVRHVMDCEGGPSNAKCFCGKKAPQSTEKLGKGRRGGWNLSHWRNHWSSSCTDHDAQQYRKDLKTFAANRSRASNNSILRLYKPKQPGAPRLLCVELCSFTILCSAIFRGGGGSVEAVAGRLRQCSAGSDLRLS